MKAWKTVLRYMLLPFAFIWHCAKKMGKFIERKSKPAIAVLVAVTIILSVLPLQTLAADEVDTIFQYENIYYMITAIGNSPTVVIAERNYGCPDYKGEHLTIPEMVPYNGVEYTVTEIRNNAFNRHQTITTIELPDTIKTLGGTSFADTNLTSFTVPPLVEAIPAWIFSGCNSLETVTITRTDKVVALEAANAFNGITNNVTILVPLGMEDDYKADASWSSMKARITDGVHLISFDGGGAEGEMETGSVPNGQAYTLPACSFTAPTGKQFKVWKIGDNEYAPGASFKPTGDVTATAVWEPYTYSVTLDANGGTIADGKNITSYKYGTAEALPTENEITYTGHTFAGWYEDKDFSGEAATAISATDEGDKTYYAKWEHSYNRLNNNYTHHWYECVCGEKNNEEEHIGGQYSASDNTITEICTECNVSIGTATISAEISEYSGNPFASASVSATGTLQDVNFTVTYIGRDGTIYNNTTPPTNAGKYSATISIGESENKKTASVDFSIKKATPVVTAPVANDLTYTGTAQALVSAGVAEGGTIYYKLNDGEWITDIPTAINASVYTVYYKVVGDNNHENTEANSISVTITDKTNPTGEILIKNNSWNQFWNTITFGIFCKNYVDVTITADGTGSGVAKVEYLLSETALEENNLPTDGWTTLTKDGDAYKFSILPKNKAAVYVRITDEGGNATVINSDGIVVYEDSKAIDTEVHTTYGSAQNVTVKVRLNGNTIEDVKHNAQSWINTNYCTVDGDTITLRGQSLARLGTGTYNITVSYNPMGVEDSGVTDLTTTFAVIIDKADGKVSNINISGKTYDGTAVTAPSFDQLGNGAATIEYKVKDADDNTYTTIAPKNAGDYVVRVTVTEGTNHKAASATAEFTIGRATLKDVSVQQNGTLTYDGGEVLTPTVSASAVAVNNQPITFTYSTAEDGTYGSMPSFAKAGTHTVYFKASAPNHNEATGSFTVTVDKAVVTEPTIESKVYADETLTADVPASNLYTVEENNGGIGVLENGNGYKVVLKLKDPENYKWSSTDEAKVTLSFKIIRATNEWEQTPSIEGWTYGETAKVPVGTAKFGDVSVQYTGTANDGTQFNSITAPTKAGNYTATFIVTETENYSGLETSVDFTIAKATYDMTGAKWDYDEAIKYDGKAHSVWVDESSLPNGVSVSHYTGNTHSDVGEYTANVSLNYDYHNYNEPDFNYLLDWEIVNNWTPTEYTVSGEGWMNQAFVITPADGYLISLTNTANGTWEDALTYSEETADGSVTFYLMNGTDGPISLAKTVNYKIDKSVPTGRVEFDERNSWETFLNAISFGLFYKDEVNVKVTANDTLSGVAKIEYASSNEAKTLNEVEEFANWTEYNGSFGVTLKDAKKFVYFIRITDNAGNVSYLSTDGAEYDKTAPVINGIENGKTYYTTQKVTVTDKNIANITLNSDPAGADITLNGNENTTYTIVATDKAGNSTTVTVTMKPISDLSAPIDTLTKNNVNSSNEGVLDDVKAVVAAIDTANATEEEKTALKEIADKAAELEKVIDDTKAEINRINEELNKFDDDTVNSDDTAELEQLGKDIEALTQTENLTEDEKKVLKDAKEKAEGLLDIIEDTAKAADTENTEKVEDVTTENVTPEDKIDLEKAKADLEKALEDNDSNYTEDEKKAIENEIKRIEDALEVIGNVEEVEKLIDKLPAVDTVKPDDEEAIKAIINAQTVYNALSDYEKSLVDEDTKESLDKLVAALVAYDIVEGDGSSWTEDSDHSITFVVNGSFSKFVGIKVDGKDVDKANYEANAGSTIITLKSAFLDTLAAGEHTITVIYTDGETEGTFNVHANVNSPETGDNSNIWLWFALLFVSGIGIFGITYTDRKRKAATKR